MARRQLSQEEKTANKAKAQAERKFREGLAKGGKMRKYKRINKSTYRPRPKKTKLFEELAAKVDNNDAFLAAVTGQGQNTLSSVFLFPHEGDGEERVYVMLNLGVNRTKTSLILTKEEAKLLGLKLMRLSYGHKGE